MSKSIGVPFPSSRFRALQLINNSAFAYGNDIATSPYESVVLENTFLSLIPMINLVNVSLLLKDSFGQKIKGTVDIPIPYILESWVCSSDACEIQESLSPLTFLTFDPSGIANSVAVKQTIPCGSNSSTVTLQYSLYGSTSTLLIKKFTVLCVGCDASQERVYEVTTNGYPIWFCRFCLAGQYIINPNLDTCQDCPAGKPFISAGFKG